MENTQNEADGEELEASEIVSEQPAKQRKIRSGELFTRYGLLIAWAVVIVVFSIVRPQVFFTLTNFQSILSTQSVLLIVSLALVPAMAAGEFDLSVGGVVGLSLVIIGYLNILKGVPIGIAILVAMASGLAVGLINAFFVVYVGIGSMVTTLGMGSLLYGVAMAINNLSISGISDVLVNACRTKVFGVQMAFYYALMLTLVIWYIFEYTPLGRYIFFVGAGRDAARLTGIRVDAIRAGTLIASSVISAFAGVVLAGILGSAGPTAGASYLLPAFASAYLGSTTIKPGRFNAWGVFVAVYFLVTGITGLQLVGLSGWIEQVFYGASLILAVAFSYLAGKKRTSS